MLDETLVDELVASVKNDFGQETVDSSRPKFLTKAGSQLPGRRNRKQRACCAAMVHSFVPSRETRTRIDLCHGLVLPATLSRLRTRPLNYGLYY